MKLKFVLCVLILIFGISSAYANVQTFDHFSVDVPVGWDADLQDSTLIIKSRSTDASITVAFNQMDNEDFTDIVERLYLQMDGTDLEQDEDGDYSFNFRNLAGVDSVALITGAEEYYLVLSITGFDDESVQKDLEQILDTIDWNE